MKRCCRSPFYRNSELCFALILAQPSPSSDPETRASRASHDGLQNHPRGPTESPFLSFSLRIQSTNLSLFHLSLSFKCIGLNWNEWILLRYLTPSFQKWIYLIYLVYPPLHDTSATTFRTTQFSCKATLIIFHRYEGKVFIYFGLQNCAN